MSQALPLSRFLLSAALLTFAVDASAELELPAPSPAASVSQRVGLTDISVEYSSPGVKGRKIWGGLVPYKRHWRTGANASTKITFSNDVTFGGKPVPAGTYSIVTLPTPRGFWVVLSRELGLFSGGKAYTKKDDVVRVKAKTTKVPHRERMAFLFSDTTDSETSLDLEWEKLRISVPITVDTAAHAQASIADMKRSTGRQHANAARYLASTSKDYDAALAHIDSSLAIEPTWFNNWIKADILAKKGDYQQARKHAQIAWELGNKADNFFYKDRVKKALADWKGKS